MTLNAPTLVVFFISLGLALIGLLAATNMLTFLPIAAVWLVAAAYGLLAAACLVRGL